MKAINKKQINWENMSTSYSQVQVIGSYKGIKLQSWFEESPWQWINNILYWCAQRRIMKLFQMLNRAQVEIEA